jgi:hypothetical protein
VGATQIDDLELGWYESEQSTGHRGRGQTALVHGDRLKRYGSEGQGMMSRLPTCPLRARQSGRSRARTVVNGEVPA